MNLSRNTLAVALSLVFFLSGALLADGFAFLGASNRFITPNGDGKNDDVAFSFYNPAYSMVQGYIYDLKGHLVADTTPPSSTDINGQLFWNGKSNGGSTVSIGVYVYVITCESNVFRGVVVVMR
jgi:hypothetical protein